jgi:hypothetical protein
LRDRRRDLSTDEDRSRDRNNDRGRGRDRERYVYVCTLYIETVVGILVCRNMQR